MSFFILVSAIVYCTRLFFLFAFFAFRLFDGGELEDVAPEGPYENLGAIRGQAHRAHLRQRMARKRGWGHQGFVILVSCIFLCLVLERLQLFLASGPAHVRENTPSPSVVR